MHAKKQFCTAFRSAADSPRCDLLAGDQDHLKKQADYAGKLGGFCKLLVFAAVPYFLVLAVWNAQGIDFMSEKSAWTACREFYQATAGGHVFTSCLDVAAENPDINLPTTQQATQAFASTWSVITAAFNIIPQFWPYLMAFGVLSVVVFIVSVRNLSPTPTLPLPSG